MRVLQEVHVVGRQVRVCARGHGHTPRGGQEQGNKKEKRPGTGTFLLAGLNGDWRRLGLYEEHYLVRTAAVMCSLKSTPAITTVPDRIACAGCAQIQH